MAQMLNEMAHTPEGEKYLKDLVENLENYDYPEGEDTGHDNLMTDLVLTLNDALKFQFHDFKNTKYATPKVALIARLEQLIGFVKVGKYDNASPKV